MASLLSGVQDDDRSCPPSSLGDRSMTTSARLLTLVLSTLVAVAGLLPVPAASAAGYQVTPNPQHTWTANKTVYDILAVGDRVYIAGSFDNVRNMATGQRVARNRLAAFDRATGALLSWNPGADNTVRSLAASSDGSVVYAAGTFLSAGGAANARIAALDATSGASLPGFQASANAAAMKVLTWGDSVFAAGGFRTVNGVARRAVVKLDGATGAVQTGFNARVGSARVVALDDSGDGRLVMGGSFEGLAGAPQNYLAAVSPDTGAASSTWAPEPICDGCNHHDLAVQDGVVYVAVGGPGGGRAAAWTLDVNRRKWSRGADGDVQAVDVRGTDVYFGGHFGPTFSDTPAHQLVALTASNGEVQSWQVPFVGIPKPGVWAVDAGEDFLRIGGAFRGIGTTGTAARYAVLPPV
jgi:hypothetical protein